MKELKRLFQMTKKEVEYNLAILSYHRKFVKASDEISKIRNSQNIYYKTQKKMIEEIRQRLIKDWEEISERISNNN